jgi:serine/threonine protein phosphatase PrpC
MGSSSPTEINEMLVTSFERTNSELIQNSKFDLNLSGSTAVVSVVRENIVTCANLGDSRAIVGRLTGAKWEAISLTTDHKPTDPGEYERIHAAGGRVFAAKN